jgi:glucose-1-phosphate adenylyltransferase
MIGRYRHISILPPFLGTEATDWYRGSADAVFKNLDYVQYHQPEEILILSGDHIYKMDYQDMIHYHHEKQADLTIAFIKVPKDESHRFGMASISSEDGKRGGRVEEYWEKPTEPVSNWASLTVLCFRPEVLYKALAENQGGSSYEFGHDIIPMLVQQNYRVYGYKFCGYWGYTRTIEEYWQSNMDLLGENPLIDLEKWGFRTNLDHRGIRDFQPVLTGNNATIKNSLIYNGCIIDGTVNNSVLFPGVHVQKGAVVENSVVFFSNTIGEYSRLNNVVADVNNTYGRNVVIGAASGSPAGKITVMGWNNHVPDQTHIEEGATIYPNQGTWPTLVKSGEVLR